MEEDLPSSPAPSEQGLDASSAGLSRLADNVGSVVPHNDSVPPEAEASVEAPPPPTSSSGRPIAQQKAKKLAALSKKIERNKTPSKRRHRRSNSAGAQCPPSLDVTLPQPRNSRHLVIAPTSSEVNSFDSTETESGSSSDDSDDSEVFDDLTTSAAELKQQLDELLKKFTKLAPKDKNSPKNLQSKKKSAARGRKHTLKHAPTAIVPDDDENSYVKLSQKAIIRCRTIFFKAGPPNQLLTRDFKGWLCWWNFICNVLVYIGAPVACLAQDSDVYPIIDPDLDQILGFFIYQSLHSNFRSIVQHMCHTGIALIRWLKTNYLGNRNHRIDAYLDDLQRLRFSNMTDDNRICKALSHIHALESNHHQLSENEKIQIIRRLVSQSKYKYEFAEFNSLPVDKRNHEELANIICNSIINDRC